MSSQATSHIHWTKLETQASTIASVNGDKVHSLTLNAPQLKPNELHQALPHLVAKELITPVEEMHIAHSKPSKNGDVVAWCMSESDYQTLRKELLSSSIAGLVPDYMALPYYDNDWTVLVYEEYICVRTGKLTGFSQRAELIYDTLKHEQLSNTPNSIHFISSSHLFLNDLKQWAKKQNIPFDVESCDIPFTRDVPTEINLLKKKDRPKGHIREFLLPSLVFLFSTLGFLATQFGSAYFENQLYINANSLIRNKIRYQKATALPRKFQMLSLADIKTKVDVMLARRQTPFNSCINSLGRVLERAPGAKLLRFHYQNKKVTASFSLPNKMSPTAILSFLLKSELLTQKTEKTSNGIVMTITLKGAL